MRSKVINPFKKDLKTENNKLSSQINELYHDSSRLDKKSQLLVEGSKLKIELQQTIEEIKYFHNIILEI